MRNKLGDDINSSNPINATKMIALLKQADTFVGLDCIKQMFQYLGGYVGLDNLILIAHNAKNFDSYLVLQNTTMNSTKVLKRHKVLLNFNITIPILLKVIKSFLEND